MAAIRHARPADASALAAIWNPLIRDTAVTFNPQERSVPEIATMIATRAAAHLPWLVLETQAGPAGFATFAPFRAGEGYARTMEHSIILAPGASGKGHGRALMERLVAEAEARAVRSLIAAVSAENAAGLAFHARLGFTEVGRIPDAGFKFGRFIALVLMQRRLGEG